MTDRHVHSGASLLRLLSAREEPLAAQRRRIAPVVACGLAIIAAALTIASFVALRYAFLHSQRLTEAPVASLLANELLADGASTYAEAAAHPSVSGYLRMRPDALLVFLNQTDSEADSLGGCARRLSSTERERLNAAVNHSPHIVSLCRSRYLLTGTAPLQMGGTQYLLAVLQPLHYGYSDLLHAIADHAPYWFFTGAVVPIGLVVLIIVLWRKLGRGLDGITNAANRVLQGDLDVSFPMHLFRELNDLAALLTDMTTEVRSRIAGLKEEDADRRSMLHTLVHDIRTPFASMRIALDLHNTHRTNADRSARYDAVVRVALDALRRLSESLARLGEESGSIATFRLDEFDVEPLFERLTLELAALAEEKKITLRVEGGRGVRMRADAQLLQRALQNLATNALRFAPPDTEVTVACAVHGTSLLFTVTDQGKGIPAAEQERIFSPFARAESERGSQTGVGLGLSFVRDVALIHGGAVSLESTPEKETTFTLQLPLQATGVARIAEVSEDRTGAGIQAAPASNVLELICTTIICISAFALLYLTPWSADLVLTIPLAAYAATTLRRVLSDSGAAALRARGRLRARAAAVVAMFAFSDLFLYQPQKVALGLYLGASVALLARNVQRRYAFGLIGATIAALYFKNDGLLVVGTLIALLLSLTPYLLDALRSLRWIGLRYGALLFACFCMAACAHALATWYTFTALQRAHGERELRILVEPMSELLNPLFDQEDELLFAIAKQHLLGRQFDFHIFKLDGTILHSTLSSMRASRVVNKTLVVLSDLTPPVLHKVIHYGGEPRAFSLPLETLVLLGAKGSTGQTAVLLAASGPSSFFRIVTERIFSRTFFRAFARTIAIAAAVFFLIGFYINSQLRRPFLALLDALRRLREGGTPIPISSAGSTELRDLQQLVQRLVPALTSLRESVTERVLERKRFVERIAGALKDTVIRLEAQVQEPQETNSNSVDYLQRSEKLMELLLGVFARAAGGKPLEQGICTLEEFIAESEDSLLSAYPQTQARFDVQGGGMKLAADLESLLSGYQLLLREAAECGSLLAVEGVGLSDTVRVTTALNGGPRSSRLSLLIELLGMVARENNGTIRHSEDADGSLQYTIVLTFPARARIAARTGLEGAEEILR